MVSAIVTAGMSAPGAVSVGMPRPLSSTRTAPSACSVTTIRSACPASASSTELSTISQIRWCRPRSPVEPMYMPGRLRTASRPSSTWIAEASYDVPAAGAVPLSTGFSGVLTGLST